MRGDGDIAPEDAEQPGQGSGIERAGLYWSFASFAIVGSAGLALNLIVEHAFGREALGRFNVLLAVFLIGGQAGSLGIQSAVLYHAPRASAFGQPVASVLRAGLKVNAVGSTFCAVAVVGAGALLFSTTGNVEYRDGLFAMFVGLALYPLNKTLLAFVNGLRQIRLYSTVFAGRYVVLITLVGLIAATGGSPSSLPWAISLTEVVLFALLCLINQRHLRSRSSDGDAPALGRVLLGFGVRGLAGGLLLDLNTRVDILILGALTGSSAVGRYSIASMFAEGIYQLALVSRSSLDPAVAHLYLRSEETELRRLFRTGRLRVYALIAPVGVMSMLLYLPVVGALFDSTVARETLWIYVILAGGVCLSAGFIPFTSVLQQTGEPGRQSLLLALVSGTNIVMNLALVPMLGVYGSALGTGIAQVALVFYIRTMSRCHLGYSV